MPELPEVEIEREKLEGWLAGRRILRAKVPDPILRGGQSRRSVESALAGATIREVSRRGKFLLIELARDRPRLLVHLGMTGRFALLARGEKEPKFTRAVLELSRGERLAFADARRLGEFRLVRDKERKRLEALGPEPLDDGFTGRTLFSVLQRSSRPIKIVLMDQHRIAGIGNIQAAEALFLARIHPEEPANELTPKQAAALSRSMRRCVREELDRLRLDGRYVNEGGENHFRVYGKGGEPCRRCKTPIDKLVQEGRSSYYCPSCQTQAD